MALSVKLVHNRSKSIKSFHDKGIIHIQFILNRKPNYINTKIKVIEHHWDKKKNRINDKCPNWHKLNLKLQGKLNKIDEYNDYCIINDKEPNADEIKRLFDKNAVNRNKTHSMNFIEFALNEIESRTDISSTTKRTHNSKIKILKEYVKGEILFSDLNHDFIQAYENHLLLKGNSINTIKTTHKIIKTYIARAVKYGLLDEKNHPYKHFKVRSEETTRENLSSRELKQFEEYIPTNNAEEVILDKFLFSCYTGMRLSDQNAVKESNFNFTSDKECYLTFKMIKVKTTIKNMPLHGLFNGKALPIVEKYIRQENKTGLFPLRSEQYTNRVLKDIAKELEITKPVTSHIGRHTFGTLLAEKTNDPILIKTLMGHKKIDTSMIYIHMSKVGIENKLKKVNWD